MSIEEQDQTAMPDGIHDTGDLGRLWDALEHLADRIDGATPTADGDVDEPPPTAP